MPAVPYLLEDDLIQADQANAAFDRLDAVFTCLFAKCSPILWLGLSGFQAAKMCGVPFVFGTKASRKILSTVDSHDQAAIDAAVAAATLGSQDDVRKQVTAELATGALGSSLVAHKRTVTPGGGGDPQPYWVRVPLVTGYHQHEHPHKLAVADVVFEGHSSRAFLWQTSWNKFRCVRFHNLDPDETPLVVTFEETGDTLSLPRWACATVRRSLDGTEWELQGFVLFRAREEDVDRMGGTFAWNPRSEVTPPHLSVWTSDAANNVASFASVWRWIDEFSTPQTPAEYLDECGDSLDGFDPRTGIHFDQGDITRNSYRLPEWPDPTAGDTKLYSLAWHGGAFFLYRKPTTDPATIVSTSASLDQLLAGHAASGLSLVIVSGNTARLRITSETGMDYADLLPIGVNLGASGHPFSVPADGVGYTMPPCPIGGPAIIRWAASTVSETVAGIGTSESTDYAFLNPQSAWDGSVIWPPWSSTISNVTGWSFPGGGRNNSHGTFLSTSVKWDGRRLAIDTILQLAPADGACPSDTAAAPFAGADPAGSLPAIASLGALNVYQSATVQAWPTKGGIWLVKEYRRRRIAPIDPPLWHPHTTNPQGNAAGDDWSGRPTMAFPYGDRIARQLPIDASSGFSGVTSAGLSDSYTRAQDSTDYLIRKLGPKDSGAISWWAANRSAAIAGTEFGGEIRPVIAVPLMARHWNVLAQRLNAVLEVHPFTYLDAQYYGRPFRPSKPGIFGGYIYPEGFLCLSTDTAAVRAADLGITVSDFRTVYSAFAGFADADLDSILPEDPPFSHPEAFRVTGSGGVNLWNIDAPLWFHPEASISPKERTSVATVADGLGGSGYTQGELAGQFGSGTDHFWWWKPNPGTYDYPDFEYLRVDAVAAAAADLGIPFRFLRLSATHDLVLCTPDTEDGFGVRRDSRLGVERQDLRLVPGSAHHFEAFAGTSELWAGAGVVRVSDWPAYPGTYGMADAACRLSVTSPMQNLDRGSGMNPFQWSSGGTWQNGDPFSGEAVQVRISYWDTTPDVTGWPGKAHRLASYPVPITQWGASDIESNPAPDVPAQFHQLISLGEFVDADDLWVAAGGSGAWGGQGAFAVHLIAGGYRPS